MKESNVMEKENSEFYVPKQSYLLRKVNKLRRKAKGKAAAVYGMINNDYSAEKINISWQNKPTRFDLVNKLIADYNYQNYLEVGCSTDACFQNIAAPNKIGVDPFSGGTHRMTSDEFFASNAQKFDIIFIDGLHTYEQVLKDILNSVDALADGGTILIHDCLPLSFYAQLPFPVGGDWNGDVWKAFVEMRCKPNVDSAVCLIDHGVGVVKKRRNQNPLSLQITNFKELKFKDLVKNYKSWLNTTSYDEITNFCGAA